MRIPILTFGAFASIIAINSVIADTTSTVTSRGYVDAQDALKQDLIPEAGVNAEENGGGESVVTYTDEEGVLGERGIYDGSTTYDSSTDADKLVTAGATRPNLNGVYDVTRRVCTQWIAGQQQTDANCLLWNLIPININYQLCTNNSDCANGGCCVSGICGDCPM